MGELQKAGHGVVVGRIATGGRRAGLWAWLLCIGAGVAVAPLHAADGASRADRGLSDSVNTFIGSQDEGNTYPGASAPFGLVQVSPIGTHYAG